MIDPSILSRQAARNVRNKLAHGRRDQQLTPEERFERRVWKRAPDECWEWLGSTNSTGYGTFNYRGKTVQTHRLAAHLAGIVPTIHAPSDRSVPEFVKHTCGLRKCCNPAHLVVGSFGSPWAGRVRKTLHRNAKFTHEQVEEIRRRLNAGEMQKVLAIDFSVSPQAISLIARNLTYKVEPKRSSAWDFAALAAQAPSHPLHESRP